MSCTFAPGKLFSTPKTGSPDWFRDPLYGVNLRGSDILENPAGHESVAHRRAMPGESGHLLFFPRLFGFFPMAFLAFASKVDFAAST